jgi:hypothetical protein
MCNLIWILHCSHNQPQPQWHCLRCVAATNCHRFGRITAAAAVLVTLSSQPGGALADHRPAAISAVERRTPRTVRVHGCRPKLGQSNAVPWGQRQAAHGTYRVSWLLHRQRCLRLSVKSRVCTNSRGKTIKHRRVVWACGRDRRIAFYSKVIGSEASFRLLMALCRSGSHQRGGTVSFK